ncbi:MAG: acylneuraminate cytidylyltransferase family protein [Planctomycetota bacterium]
MNDSQSPSSPMHPARSPSITALVPMRHDSERVRGKNFRPLAGRPLYHHVVRALLACQHIDEIVIDTDSPTITEDCAQSFGGSAGPRVRVIPRPEHLRDGHIPMNEVLRHDTTQAGTGKPDDLFLQTHSTNPFLQTETITAAIEAFLAHRDQHDSLFGVTRWQTRLYDQHGSPINHNPTELLRTQDLPPVFEENSNLYLFTRAVIEATGRRMGERPRLFEIDRLEATDIDDEEGWRLAEALVLTGQLGQPAAAPAD